MYIQEFGLHKSQASQPALMSVKNSLCSLNQVSADTSPVKPGENCAELEGFFLQSSEPVRPTSNLLN